MCGSLSLSLSLSVLVWLFRRRRLRLLLLFTFCAKGKFQDPLGGSVHGAEDRRAPGKAASVPWKPEPLCSDCPHPNPSLPVHCTFSPMGTKRSVIERNAASLPGGAAALICKPRAKYVQVSSDIRLLQSHRGACCRNLEMALQAGQRHPQHGRSGRGRNQSGQTDLSAGGFRSLFSTTPTPP